MTALSVAARLPLNALDPVCKLPAALLFAGTVSCLRTPEAAACACLFALALAAAGGLLPGLGRKLLPVNLFFLFLWIVAPLSPDTAAPDVVCRIGPLGLRLSGLILALLITLKGNAIALAVLALAGSSSLNACGRALLRLHVPAKLVMLILLTHGNILLLRREAGRMHRAAKLRGFAPRSSLWSWRVAASLAAMLLIRAWERAERTALAMRLRGFSGTFPLLDNEEDPPRRAAAARLPSVGGVVAGVVGGAGLLALVLDRMLSQGHGL